MENKELKPATCSYTKPHEFSEYSLSCCFNIHLIPSHLLVGLPSALFPSDLSTKTLHALLFYLMHSTCPSHLFLLDFVILMIFDEAYKSRSSSSCSLFQPDIISASQVSIIFGNSFSNNFAIYFLIATDQFSHPCKKKTKLQFVYFDFHVSKNNFLSVPNI